MSEQPILYKRKRKPPGSEKKHGWLFWLLIIVIPLSAIASSSLSVERKLSDAVAGYLPLWTATTACLKISGAQDVTIESLDNFSSGGTNQFSTITSAVSPASLRLDLAKKRVVARLKD